MGQVARWSIAPKRARAWRREGRPCPFGVGCFAAARAGAEPERRNRPGERSGSAGIVGRSGSNPHEREAAISLTGASGLILPPVSRATLPSRPAASSLSTSCRQTAPIRWRVSLSRRAPLQLVEEVEEEHHPPRQLLFFRVWRQNHLDMLPVGREIEVPVRQGGRI